MDSEGKKMLGKTSYFHIGFQNSVLIGTLCITTTNDPLISVDHLSMVIESEDDTLYNSIEGPFSGDLPEIQLKGSFAFVQFSFDIDKSVKLKRAVIKHKNEQVEFIITEIEDFDVDALEKSLEFDSTHDD